MKIDGSREIIGAEGRQRSKGNQKTDFSAIYSDVSASVGRNLAPKQMTGLSEAVETVPVRNITYQQSDRIHIAVLEGYALKAQMSDSEPSVYVEAKYEDGRVEGYNVDVARVGKDTGNEIEQLAFQTYYAK